ncbi:ATP-binding protein [Micromonospora sp. NBC_01655]|uniref:ATP-binding protein n=1 Tax=unclassified Micromonospora TaxID=2617518 RepID=UPI0014051937|nr:MULTISPECIES: ATP-binding protein [unclassified Micromonospora]MCX4472928.1 ATP-binding protein [Micromonospora sp. NBC_01655]
MPPDSALSSSHHWPYLATLPVLPNAGTASAEGRRFVAEHLHRWRVPDQVADTAVLLTSEIITNAVRYAAPPLGLRVGLRAGQVRVEVTDSNPELPVLARPDFEALGGRGMWLIDTLAAAWGCHPDPRGKIVWCEVHVPAPDGS